MVARTRAQFWKGRAATAFCWVGQVVEGSAKVLVTAVGVHSEWGKTLALVASEAGDTPLQEALGSLASAIGKVGLAVGAICFVVLMIRWAQEAYDSYPPDTCMAVVACACARLEML